MKYQIIAYKYLNNQPEFSDRMEALAAEFIREKELNFEVDDLWNDATAEQAYKQLQMAQEYGNIFYADDFFSWVTQDIN